MQQSRQNWRNWSAADKLALLQTLKARNRLNWKPLPGPQSMAYACRADVLLYGGAAGGGKTDLALGKALTQHQRSLILRREFPQLKGILQRAEELYSEYGRYGDKVWRCEFAGKRRIIEFGSVQHEADKNKFQGRPHDLKVFDEAANFLESQVEFIAGWNRSEDPDQHCQVLLCSNPPTDATGDWLNKWFAPWLDPAHPNPAAPGELRWFASIDGEQHECETGDPFILVDGRRVYDFDPQKVKKVDIIRPLTRTFIPARVTDNPFYADSGYVAKLQALPEPLRSKMLYGDFGAGRQDDRWQIIPSEWVRMAQRRWVERPECDAPMTSLGVDVARGGQDKTILSPRHGNWYAPQVSMPGKETPDGEAVAAQVLLLRQPRTAVNIDVIGVGTSPYDILKGKIKVYAVAMNGSEGSEAKDRTGNLGFVNKRAEWWWRMREALDPVHGDDLALPPDPQLAADLCAPRWKMTARGIQVESKEEIKKRIGRSPDKGDSAVYALADGGAMALLARHLALAS
ncbi:terminase [Cupriavidus sp. DB3]|uniref:terminase n=1 Tax=Cupriavidus sp. DB3 TaxID=2873259 RepID=UPI001CF3FBBC|nr:terminase [Cupriavidus sp. DB3]MCA7086061.1 terminase [Cupriavidus sp. DB3]